MRYYNREVVIVPQAEYIDWSELIEEQASSGMNMKDFCKQRNISYDIFKYHKYSLRDKAESANKRFLPVSTDASDKITFSLNGNIISCDASLNQETLSKIVKAVLS